MSAWLDYRLSDFLMYSPRVYHRLLELYNAAIWPVHLIAFLLGLALMVFAVRGGGSAVRPMAAILAAAWVWVALAFLHQRYATINWAAVYIAVAFLVEAGWLALMALRARPGIDMGFTARGCPGSGLYFMPTAPPSAAQSLGLALMAFAIFVYPFLAMAKGRPWLQAELFGLMPDPTIMATLGALLIWRGRFRLWGAIVPLACCLVSGATSWTLGEPAAWAMPLVAIIAVGALVMDRLFGKPLH
jgi:hypothetical protein